MIVLMLCWMCMISDCRAEVRFTAVNRTAAPTPGAAGNRADKSNIFVQVGIFGED